MFFTSEKGFWHTLRERAEASRAGYNLGVVNVFLFLEILKVCWKKLFYLPAGQFNLIGMRWRRMVVVSSFKLISLPPKVNAPAVVLPRDVSIAGICDIPLIYLLQVTCDALRLFVKTTGTLPIEK